MEEKKPIGIRMIIENGKTTQERQPTFPEIQKIGKGICHHPPFAK